LAGDFVAAGKSHPALVTMHDVHGNQGMMSVTIPVNARPAVAQAPASAAAGGFTPNGDLLSDTMRIALTVAEPSALVWDGLDHSASAPRRERTRQR
jgi:hypothetical protein